MTLMKRPLLILAAATALLVSCKIDRDYDLEKPLNTRMILFKDLNIPIGNVGAIQASTLMFLLGTDYITFNDDGHLVLDFTDNPEMVFQFDIKGLKVNVNYEMEKAFGFILDMDVTNTSPFSFSVEASFIDSLGTVIPTYHPLISGGVRPIISSTCPYARERRSTSLTTCSNSSRPEPRCVTTST